MHSESFKVEHLNQIDPAGGKDIILMVKGSIIQADKSGNMIGFSLVHEQKIIAIGGIYDLWPGVGEAISFMSEDAFKYPKSLFSAFSRGLSAGIKIKKYWRVQAMVKAGFDEGTRFIEHLGFEQEGLMRKWAPDGTDFYIYARVK